MSLDEALNAHTSARADHFKATGVDPTDEKVRAKIKKRFKKMDLDGSGGVTWVESLYVRRQGSSGIAKLQALEDTCICSAPTRTSNQWLHLA